MGGYFFFFLISGFCGILYELVWLRLAMAQYGVTTPIVSIVLSAFMGGLGIGSLGAGMLLRRYGTKISFPPLWLYAGSELHRNFRPGCSCRINYRTSPAFSFREFHRLLVGYVFRDFWNMHCVGHGALVRFYGCDHPSGDVCCPQRPSIAVPPLIQLPIRLKFTGSGAGGDRAAGHHRVPRLPFHLDSRHGA